MQRPRREALFGSVALSSQVGAFGVWCGSRRSRCGWFVTVLPHAACAAARCGHAVTALKVRPSGVCTPFGRLPPRPSTHFYFIFHICQQPALRFPPFTVLQIVVVDRNNELGPSYAAHARCNDTDFCAIAYR